MTNKSKKKLPEKSEGTLSYMKMKTQPNKTQEMQ